MKGEGKMAKYHRIIIDGVPYYREYSYGMAIYLLGKKLFSIP
ncbi:hypothetical protein TAF16_1951 [Anoxybacillus flavithermus]|uniref:Uncharacterized protein n=2 Tax=Anoxybacillus flavithermus TaxID=33934 RepID=A0A178TB84_9BACL|nr:hypothetical protein TAF16_1951 [Anoxybacillus flavithermus]